MVNKYKGDYYKKHFNCWDHLASMMIAHIRQEDSLRDIALSMPMPASCTTSVSNNVLDPRLPMPTNFAIIAYTRNLPEP